MLWLDRTKKYLSVDARWPPKLCTHPLAAVVSLQIVEHLARAVAVFFRRMRNTAASQPQKVYLHRTGQEDQLSQDFSACYTLKVNREAGMLHFPDRILVGAQGRVSVASFTVLVLPLSGKEFACHGMLSSMIFTFTGTMRSTTFAFAIAFIRQLPEIMRLQILLEGGAVVLVLPDVENIPPLFVCQDVVVGCNVVLEEEV